MGIDQYDGQAIRALKERVLSGGRLTKTEPFAHLAEEWLRSQASGAKRHCMRLDDSKRNLRVFDNLDRQHFTHLAYMKEYYNAKSNFFKSQGAALLYLDETLSVFYKSGDRELLDKLKQQGVRMGSVLSEQNVGRVRGEPGTANPVRHLHPHRRRELP